MKYEYLLVENEEYFFIDRGIDFPPSVYFKEFHESEVIELHFETYFDLDNNLVAKSQEEVRSMEFDSRFSATVFNFFIDPTHRNIIGLGFINLGFVPVFLEIKSNYEVSPGLLSPVLAIEADEFYDDNIKYLPIRGSSYNQGLIKIGFGQDFVKLYFSNAAPNRYVSNGSCIFGIDELQKDIIYIIINNLSVKMVYDFIYTIRPERWKEKHPQIYNNPKPHEFIQYGYIDAMW